MTATGRVVPRMLRLAPRPRLGRPRMLPLLPKLVLGGPAPRVRRVSVALVSLGTWRPVPLGALVWPRERMSPTLAVLGLALVAPCPRIGAISPWVLPRSRLVRVARLIVWLYVLADGGEPPHHLVLQCGHPMDGMDLGCRVSAEHVDAIVGAIGGTGLRSQWSRALVVPSGLISRRASGSTLGPI